MGQKFRGTAQPKLVMGWCWNYVGYWLRRVSRLPIRGDYFCFVSMR